MTSTERWRGRAVAGLWLLAAVTLLSIAAQNVVFFGMAAWLLWRSKSGKGWPPIPPALRWALPFLAWSLLASALAENRGHSLETWRRWLLIFIAVYAADLLDEETSLRSVFGSLLLFSGLWALGASVLAMSGPFAAWLQGEGLASILGRWAEADAWRAVSGSGGYMVLGTGSMLVLCFFFGLSLEDGRWRRPLPLACLLALALALYLTQTRSAWIGAVGGLGAVTFLRKPAWGAAAVATLLLLALLWPRNPVMDRLQRGLDMKEGSTRERVFMLRGAREMVAAHPWLGIGDSLESWRDAAGDHEGVYVRVQKPHARFWGFPLETEQGHLHSIPSQIAVMYGLPGLLFLLLFAGRLAAAAWSARRSLNPLARGAAYGMLAAWLAWWLNGLLEFNFGSTQSSFTLWLLWGLSLAAFKMERA